MAASDFVTELRALGLAVTELGDGRVTFPYEVPVGARAGEAVTLGFVVPGDYNLSCPGGPCVRPRLLPINPDGSKGHPMGAVHPAPQFGDDWEYWSRPFPGWGQSARNARAYMAHIAHLFATLS